MRGISKLVVLAAAVAMAAGCSQSAKPAAATGVQHGVQGKYFYVNLFSPPIGGIVSSLPAGVSCGASSLGTPVPDSSGVLQYAPAYYTGADRCGQIKFNWTDNPVVLTAAPQGSNAFLGWAGDCSGTGPCTLTPGADKTVYAIFGVAGSSHGYMASPTDHGPVFFASIAGTNPLKCARCHGPTYNGQGIAPSCTACHAAAGKPNWLADCTFCHAAPPASRSHQFVTAGDLTACAACHPTTVTATGTIVAGGTHMNGVVDDAFSSGGRNCATCHGALMGDATTFHHVMGSLADGWTTYPNNPQPTSAADKSCVQCHVDHDLFTGARGSNLRALIGGASVTAANTDGGLCTSCHGLSQTKGAGQKPDGTLGTAAIDATTYWAGGHSFMVGGSITGADFDFQVTCTKCHNSSAATQFQDGVFKFGLHTSVDRRLRAALGRASLTDDDADGFCLRCHSLSTDAVGAGGKATSGLDWYGVRAMPNGSTGVFAQFNGVPAQPTTTTDTLYFKPLTEEAVSAPAPSGPGAEPAATATNTLYLTNAAFPQAFGNQLASGTYTTGALVQNSMSLTGVAATATTLPVTTVSGATAYDRIAQWISPPFASGASWASGNVVLYIYRQESATTANCFFRYAAYKLSGGVLTPVVNPTSGTSEFSTTAGIQNFNMALLANSSFAAGDQLVVELEVYKNAPTAAGTCSVTYGNTAVDQSRVVFPATAAGSFPEFAGSVTQSTTWVARSMSPYLPTAANETITGTETSAAFAAQLWERASFVSLPLSAAASVPAGTWALSVNANRGSFGSSTAYLRYRLYKLNASGSAGTEITPWTTRSTALGGSTAAVAISATGAAVSFLAGDKVVVDLEVESMNTTSALAANANLIFGSGNPSSVKAPAAMVFPAVTPAVVPAYGHFGALYTGIHKPNPAEENLNYLAGAKHVECSDCHDAHGAKRGNQADGGTATAASATTLTDSNQAWLPNAWVGYSVDILAGTGAGGRAQITANDATTLTFGTLATAPVAGSTYRVSMKSNGGAVVTATTTSLTDSQSAIGGAKAWATNAFAGFTVRIVLGTGVGQTKKVAANDATSLTLVGTWDVTPDTTSRYVVDALPGVLAGATGVNVTAWDAGTPTAWDEAKTLTPAPGSTTAIPAATTQWQVCFKCHSDANANLTGWKAGWSDLASEFNPRNQSYHPIVAPSAAFAGTGFGNTQVSSANLSGGWKPGDVMYCSDCHGNTETGYAASQGPHASAVPFMLRGTATRWPSMANGTTRWTTSNYTTGAGTKDGLFCLNCHGTLASVHTRGDHSGTACTSCHILIPHGGKLKRLMATAAYAGRAAATYVNRGSWAATTAYAVNDYVRVGGTGRYLICSTAGTSAAAAPTVPGSSGQTVTDGTVVWTAGSSSNAPTNVTALPATAGTPAPYRDTAVTQVINAYIGGASDDNGSCGVNCTTHHSLAPSTTSNW